MFIATYIDFLIHTPMFSWEGSMMIHRATIIGENFPKWLRDEFCHCWPVTERPRVGVWAWWVPPGLAGIIKFYLTAIWRAAPSNPFTFEGPDTYYLTPIRRSILEPICSPKFVNRRSDPEFKEIHSRARYPNTISYVQYGWTWDFLDKANWKEYTLGTTWNLEAWSPIYLFRHLKSLSH